MIESHRRPFGRLLALAVLLLILLAMVLAVLGWHRLQTPLNPRGAVQVFEVAPGDTPARLRDRLVAGRILAPSAPLLLYARLTGLDRGIKSGFYELSASMSPREILDTLVAGEVLMVQVTIPEGWTLEKIFPRLIEALDFDAGQFAAAANDSAWLATLGVQGGSLEGYLFPETYRFARGVGPRRVLATLVRGCLTWFEGERGRRADSLGLSIHEVLTLASIIEAETALAAEKAHVSAVYHNRLAGNWLLQADPTVAYAAGRVGETLWEKHLRTESPYNTYLHTGLPPGPICAPGLGSIDAALYPQPGCRDFYFVARGDGSHIFSRTLSAHNRAREEVRRRR